MLIRVRLFAIARERAGASEVAVELAEGATVADLRAALADQCPALRPLMPGVMLALDAEYAADDAPVPPGAEAALIPPVSGGAPEA